MKKKIAAAIALFAIAVLAGVSTFAQSSPVIITGEQLWNRIMQEFSHLSHFPAEQVILTHNRFLVISLEQLMEELGKLDIQKMLRSATQWTLSHLLRLRLQESFGEKELASVAVGCAYFGGGGHPTHRGWWWGLIALVRTEQGERFVFIHPFVYPWKTVDVRHDTVKLIIM